MTGLLKPFRDNARISLALVGAVALTLAGTAALLANTANLRYSRDIHRIGFNDNWKVLDDIRQQLGLVTDSAATTGAETATPAANQPYIVVSIADRRLWYKKGDSTLYSTRVAVGSGKTLVQTGSHDEYKFDTPRGRLVVQSKESDPIWVPPDWHFVEQAKKKGLKGIIQLQRGQPLKLGDGTEITVDGTNVVKRFPDGRVASFETSEGHEIVADGKVVVPPYGTNQRKYVGVLGTHRLNLGDGYGLHGTDEPNSIGKAVSHGCVRLRNEDIAYLYGIVPVGTVVYIY